MVKYIVLWKLKDGEFWKEELDVPDAGFDDRYI